MNGLNATNVTEPNEQTSGKPLTQSTQEGTLFPRFSPNFQLDTEIVCPCCHQVSMEKAWQEAMIPKPDMMGYWQYHCRNPKCAGYGRTLPLAQFTATYGIQETRQAKGASDESNG